MRTSKYLFRILFFLLLIVTSGCKKEETPKDIPAVKPNEIIIAKEAKIINNQIWNENLISIDSTNFTLTLKVGINSYKITEGDIIITSDNEGLLRKVKQSNQIGDRIVIATEPAALSEVVKQGVIEYYQPLTTSQIKDVEYMYEGVELINDLVKSNGNVFNWDIDAVLYDLDGNQETKNDQIKLVGTFNCDWRILLKIDIGISNGLKEVKFGFVSNENLNLKLIGGVSYEFEKDIVLAKVNFNPIVIMVGAVPVVFTPQLKIIVGIDGYSEASISSEVSQNLSFDTGIHYLKGQGWSPFKTFDKSLTFKPPQLAMNASASMYLKPEFLIKVYSVAGPYANVKIYGKLDADLLKTPWWTLYGGIKMSAGAKVDILEKFLLDFAVSDLINMEQVLAQATIPPSQTATIKTVSPSEITSISAKSGGEISSDGGSTVTARGVCWSTTQNPTTTNSKTVDGSGTGSFTSSITGLTPNTTYYLRAYAINSQGTAYGTQINFKTGQALSLATVTTNAATNITTTGATLGGNVTSDGNASVTERGVVYSTTQNPTTSNTKVQSGSGTGAFTVNVSDLSTNTTYYIRAYAINSEGTAYGSNVSFKTQAISGNTVTDIDGNVYNTVAIGTQTWMRENLKTTRYRNGDLIGTTSPATLDISNSTTYPAPKYQWAYSGNESNVATYGRLYTWYAATDSRNICPIGWHVPNDAEWTVLTTFLGGESVAGGKLKESGTSHWLSPNLGATNSSNFTALPGGYRDTNGIFDAGGRSGYWWRPGERDASSAWSQYMNYSISNTGRGYGNKALGFSVRCLRDN